jgi:hypothetical protein
MQNSPDRLLGRTQVIVEDEFIVRDVTSHSCQSEGGGRAVRVINLLDEYGPSYRPVQILFILSKSPNTPAKLSTLQPRFPSMSNINA